MLIFTVHLQRIRVTHIIFGEFSSNEQTFAKTREPLEPTT